jgi:hypothetical protein
LYLYPQQPFQGRLLPRRRKRTRPYRGPTSASLHRSNSSTEEFETTTQHVGRLGRRGCTLRILRENEPSGRAWDRCQGPAIPDRNIRIFETVLPSRATSVLEIAGPTLSAKCVCWPCSIKTNKVLVGLQLDTLPPAQMNFKDMLLSVAAYARTQILRIRSAVQPSNAVQIVYS